MWTHGNTYILYYICPMHTFYFFMVYATMFVLSSVNYSKWGIRIKLMAVGVLIYIIWDVNKGLFDSLFSWLGTDSVIGAGRGSVWEYYFRTSLDHYSSFFGMIFALNFPLAEQFFVKAKGYPLILAAILMAIATIAWAVYIYPLEKLDYNLVHSYTAIVPLTSYIFFRNLTPAVRSGVSMSLHDLGKTTLETYLLQHHIWLTSNAKTLLTIVPNHPWINFAAATVLFFTVSKELYRITMSLRGMIMPDDETIALRNTIGSVIIVGVMFATATALSLVASPTLVDVLLCALAFAIVTLVAIRSTANSSMLDNNAFNTLSSRSISLGSLVLLCGVGYSVMTRSTSVAIPSLSSSSLPVFNRDNCLSSVTQGYWVHQSCPIDIMTPLTARCQSDRWEWNLSNCPLTPLTSVKARSLFQHKRITFIGDSIIRKTFHQFNQLLDSEYTPTLSKKDKQSDITIRHENDNCTVYFKWAPFLNNITDEIHHNIDSIQSQDIVVTGVAPWDALYHQDTKLYQSKLTQASVAIDKLRGYVTWILPTPVIDDLLPTPDKAKYMNQAALTEYKKSVLSSAIVSKVKVVLDPSAATLSMETGSADGLHYPEAVYDVIVQMAFNSYLLHYPDLMKNKPKSKASLGPKPTGSMSFPVYGAITLVLAAVMLFCLDSWLGFGFISLTLSGRSYDWLEAYVALHRKIGVSTQDTTRAVSEMNAVEDSQGFVEETLKGLSHAKSSDDVKSV
jgi:hypothetical protein